MFDWYRLAKPFVFHLEPEIGHGLALRALKMGLVPHPRVSKAPCLRTRLWGLDFPNPLGTAAGFDKNAEVVDAMLAQGFGFVEVGTVTPRPQPGNPRPRLFRLVADGGVVNRMGFNNEGLEAVLGRLAARRGRGGVVAVNVGKNRDSADAVADYVAGVRAVTEAELADFVVVNVSSPNTPGLRDLQGRARLCELLEAVMAARSGAAAEAPPPVLLKVAPDLAEGDKEDIAEVCLETGVDGLIATNTTISRPEGLCDAAGAAEEGGLSGRPLFDLSTRVLGDFYRLTGGRLPLIGAGGVASGAEAYAKIRAGASLVQLYSVMVFAGPGIGARILDDLARRLAADGFSSVAEAVGADHR